MKSSLLRIKIIATGDVGECKGGNEEGQAK
jgi:hypothetical protein